MVRDDRFPAAVAAMVLSVLLAVSPAPAQVGGVVRGAPGGVIVKKLPAAARGAPTTTTAPASPFADFAGKWVGKTQFQNMDVELLIGPDGAVLGGRMGTHPFQKKGQTSFDDPKQPTKANAFRISFYFSDVCRDKIKTIEKATFTASADGRHQIEGHFSNPCFPPSAGWIRLTRVETGTSAAVPGKADTLDDCEKLHMAGRYADAAKGYARLLSAKSLRVGAAVGLARAQGMVGKYAEALKALRDVEGDAADSPAWHLAMAEALNTVGRYDEALKHAAKARAMRATWAAAILQNGLLLETVGRKKEAVEVYKSMSAVLEGDSYKRDAAVLVDLGRIMDRYAVLTGQRASEQAANILHNYFQEAYLSVDKGYWPANVAAGMFLLTKYRPKNANAEFDLAAKVNPNIPDVHVGKAAIALGEWNFEACLSTVENALRINPNCADALLLKAACLMQWRKYDDVPAIVEKVLAYNPNHLEALSMMAAVHYRKLDDAKAAPYVERARKVNASYAGLPVTIAEWLSAGRQFEKAERFYREAMDLAPELAEPVTGLGRMYMQTGDEDKAYEVLKRAHDLDDYRADVVNYLNLLEKMQKYAVKETPHFIIKVDGKHDAVLLEQVAAYMESIYPEIVKDFSFEPPRKTIIEFFPFHQDFSVRITGRGWIGTVGACTGRVIALCAPNTERSQFGTHNWATVLRHEYTHTVTLTATGNRIPHWLTEACAVWEQPDKRNYKYVQMLVEATRDNKLLPVRELDWSFIRPRRQGERGLAYAQAEWILEHIIETKGFETVARMLKGFRDGLTQAEVFTRVLGVNEKRFDDGLRKWAAATVRKWGFNPDPPPDPAEWSKKARQSGDDPNAQATYAVALYYARQADAAENAARKALELDPNSTKALAVLSSLLVRKKDYDEAIALARRLERHDHTTSLAPRVLAQCYIATKQWAQAIAALELLQQRQPLDQFSYDELAKIYILLGRPEMALPNLIHLHQHTMKDPQYARQVAEILRSLGRHDEALNYFVEITHINPYQPNAYEAMAAIYRMKRDYARAVGAIENVTLVEPDSADAWAKCAMMRYLAGKAEGSRDKLLGAKEAAEKALKIDPTSQAKTVMERIAAALGQLNKT